MVFNRQIVKDNFEKDVRAKIAETQQILRQLKTSIAAVEKNSSVAKVEVNNAVSSITQQLASRQIELTQQIDLLSQSQIKSLQDRIHSTCVVLGSLQSTLNNLDSYDFSLVGLPESTAPWPQTVNVSLLAPQVDTAELNKEIKQWGNMKTKGLEQLIDPGCSSSLPVQQIELVRDAETESNKSSDALTNSKVTVKCASPTSQEPRNSQIEQWLCSMKIHNVSTDSDDFEMIPDLEMKPSDSNHKLDKASCCDGEDGSSIVCIETDEVTVSPMTEDMSKWLKPKKPKRMNDNNSSSNISDRSRQNALSGTMQTYLYKSSKRNNTLDFPCLRLDPNAWVPKRQRNMVVATNVKRQPELCLQMGQNEIIPPTYALPYPFWLKKY